MPSGLVWQSQIQGLPETSPPSQVQNTESRSSWVQLCRVGTENEGLWTQDLEAIMELRNSAFSRAELAVMPFEVMKGMEGEHIPQTNLTRHHQV